jgi:capsular polysaccharide export protein
MSWWLHMQPGGSDFMRSQVDLATLNRSNTHRNFLFLQGPASPFFRRLADRLSALGHEVFRINFCAGDQAYWGARPAWSHRSGERGLDERLDAIYRQHGITDQILFGDRRPVHRPAVGQGAACGVRTHVFEEGYFRPWWITLERDGVNAHSRLPRDPAWFADTGRRLAEPARPVRFASPFRVRAAHDVAYHVAGLLNPVLFAGYRTHAPIAAPLEYAGYVRRFGMLRLIGSRERSLAQALVASGRPFYLLPLQLNGDAQIREHSRFAHMGEVIEQVMESFARHAPSDASLVIKNHPLDMGLMNFARIVRACEQRFGLQGRTLYLEDGDLTALARHARGVVTVNSTVGLVALEHGTPTLALAGATYHLPGLTFQGALDDFWRAPEPPDATLFACFRRVVMHATQINGGLYCRAGIELAVDNASRAVLAERSPLESLS